jgi:hypothetical protein
MLVELAGEPEEPRSKCPQRYAVVIVGLTCFLIDSGRRPSSNPVGIVLMPPEGWRDADGDDRGGGRPRWGRVVWSRPWYQSVVVERVVCVSARTTMRGDLLGRTG